LRGAGLLTIMTRRRRAGGGVGMANIFVSYTSSDKNWAFWIGQELEKLGHVPHIHEWEISGGGDIAAWMEERHNKADHILCVISEAYLKKPYSSWERGAAQWAAATERPNFALPVFIEDCEASTLLAHLKRCDLAGLSEDGARARLASFLLPAARPAGAMPFPGSAPIAKSAPPRPAAVAFPGTRLAESNIPVRVPSHVLGRGDSLAAIRSAMPNKGIDAPEYIIERRIAVRQFIQRYLDHRNVNFLIGHFLDPSGCSDTQFGLGGTCFALGLKAREGYDARVLRQAQNILVGGLCKTKRQLNATERNLLKDIDRIPTKAVLLALWEDDTQRLTRVLDNIFQHGLSGDLIKHVSDNAAMDGDFFVSCYVLQLLHLSRRNPIVSNYQLPISRILTALRTRMLQGDLDLNKKLFISTTLCLFDHKLHITYHRTLLRQLYADGTDWLRGFSKDSPFIDTWYCDTIQGGSKTRFVRVPIGYIILSAIYASIGTERNFFMFIPVRKMLEELRLPFDHFVDGDRSRSAVYYVFFANVCLHPSLYFDVPRSTILRRFGMQHEYMFGNLTVFGYVCSLVTLIGFAASIYYGAEALTEVNELPTFLGAIGVTLTGLVGFVRMRKR
jgi:hypothetical protein